MPYPALFVIPSGVEESLDPGTFAHDPFAIVRVLKSPRSVSS